VKNVQEIGIQKTILMAAGIIAASVILSALIVKMGPIDFNVTARAVATPTEDTTADITAESTAETTVETTVPETTTTKSSNAVCKAPCFGYFEFVDCVDGVLRVKNGGSAITVSSVSGGTHYIRNDNPSYMPSGLITITDVPTDGSQTVEINYWVDNVLKLDVATIIN